MARARTWLAVVIAGSAAGVACGIAVADAALK